jgi:sugar/nucleoside kinase (ribokinase family)
MTIRAITDDLYEKGIVVIGSTAIDKIIHGNLSRFKIGGATTYSGITYRRHGIATKVVTNIANRDRQMIRRLQAEKIVVCNGQTPQTTHFINYVTDDQRRQKIPQRAAWIRRSQLIEPIKNAAVVHLGPLHASDIDIRAIKLLNRFKHLIILDVQGLTRSVRNNSVYPSASKQLPAFLGVSQVVKANAQEYESIIDFFRLDLLELMQQFNINEFIVTCGHRGGFVQPIDGEEITFPAYRIKSKKDPTGAGDVFLAAYVIGRFIKRRKVADACKYAAKIAARQIEGNHIKPDDLCLTDHKKQPI